jgi:transposase InsO family protein
VWAQDFVQDRTRDGRKLRMRLAGWTSSPRKALALRVERKLTSADVLETLAEFRLAELRLAEFRPDRGVPAHVRSNDGPEFVAQSVQAWIAAQGARTARIEPGSPRENGYVDGLSKPRDALLSREILPSLRHAQILIKGWRRHHNAIRPHSALRRTPPTPNARLPTPQARPPMTLPHQPRQTAFNPKAAIRDRPRG